MTLVRTANRNSKKTPQKETFEQLDKLTRKDAKRFAQMIAQQEHVHKFSTIDSSPEDLRYPQSWEKGCPIVVDFFKQLICSKILMPDIHGKMYRVDLLKLFKKMRPGKKLPANWITTANLILGYTTETGEPLKFCVIQEAKGDCFYGYTLVQ